MCRKNFLNKDDYTGNLMGFRNCSLVNRKWRKLELSYKDTCFCRKLSSSGILYVGSEMTSMEISTIVKTSEDQVIWMGNGR